jgi:hypothetical protein
MKTIIIFAVTALLSGASLAQSPMIFDSSNGQYLGNLNNNPYDPNSVSNPHGIYGNPHSPNSINNPHGQYGNRYSNKSVNNPYATQAPAIVSPRNNGYNIYGR